MLDYANENDIVAKNYARTFKLSDDIMKDVEEEKKDHIDFTDEEMKKLWNNLYDVDYVDVLLIQCYSGWRPQELGLLKMENVDLENWYENRCRKKSCSSDSSKDSEFGKVPLPGSSKIRKRILDQLH